MLDRLKAAWHALTRGAAPPTAAVAMGTVGYGGGGPIWLDEFRSKRAPTPVELVQAYKAVAYACVQLNAQGVARVPLRLYAKTAPGRARPGRGLRAIARPVPPRRERYVRSCRGVQAIVNGGEAIDEVTEHPFLEALDRPNPYFDGQLFLTYLAACLDVVGTAYFVPVRPRPGVAGREWWPLQPQYVQPIKGTGATILQEYRYFQETFAPDEVVRIRALSLRDPYLSGFSPLHACFEQVGLGNAYTAVVESILVNGARPAGLMAPKDSALPPGEAERARLEVDLNQRFGRGRAGGVLVTTGAFDFHPLTFPPADLGALEIGKHQRLQVANCFGVPISLLQAEDSNRAVAESGHYEHQRNALEPRCLAIASALTHMARAVDERLFFCFDDPVEADRDTQAKVFCQYLDHGVLSPDEVRLELGYEPAPWGGTEPYLASGLVQPSTARERAEAAAAPPPAGTRPAGSDAERADPDAERADSEAERAALAETTALLRELRAEVRSRRSEGPSDDPFEAGEEPEDEAESPPGPHDLDVLERYTQALAGFGAGADPDRDGAAADFDLGRSLRYHPDQPRDPATGQWIKGPGGGAKKVRKPRPKIPRDKDHLHHATRAKLARQLRAARARATTPEAKSELAHLMRSLRAYRRGQPEPAMRPKGASRPGGPKTSSKFGPRSARRGGSGTPEQRRRLAGQLREARRKAGGSPFERSQVLARMRIKRASRISKETGTTVEPKPVKGIPPVPKGVPQERWERVHKQEKDLIPRRRQADDDVHAALAEYQRVQADPHASSDQRLKARDAYFDAERLAKRVRQEHEAIGRWKRRVATVPDAIPPGPIAERLREWTEGDAKLREIQDWHDGLERRKAELREQRDRAQREFFSSGLSKLKAKDRKLRAAALQAEMKSAEDELGRINRQRAELFAERFGHPIDRRLGVGLHPAPNRAGDALGPTQLEDVAREQEWLHRLTARAGDRPVNLEARPFDPGEAPRAYYRNADGAMRIGPATFPSTIVHEAGHGLEHQVPGVHEAAQAFLQHRVGNEPLTDLGKFSPKMAGEKGRKDDFDRFFHEDQAYYTGKHYAHGYTEIVAMGVQALREDPGGFARKDPEYAKFVLGILGGQLR